MKGINSKLIIEKNSILALFRMQKVMLDGICLTECIKISF